MKTSKTLLFTILCACFSLQLFSQTTIGRQNVDQYPTSPWGHHIYGLTWLPTDYTSNTNQKYPLIIFLHGVGEAGTGVGGLYGLLSNGIPNKISAGWNAEAINPVDGQLNRFIVISPQAASWTCEWAQIQYILPDVISRYRVDTTRIYVTGLSAGGQGAWTCVTNGPVGAQKFAAIAPISSANAIPLDSIPKVGNQYGVKLWQVCGDQDMFWPFVTTSTNMYNSGNPTVPAIATPLPGYGHWGWNEAYDPNWRNNSYNLNVYEWLLQYKRTSNPQATPLSAYAGPAQTVTLPVNAVTLNGSATAGSGNTISSYSWTYTSGPAQYSIVSPSSASTQVTNLVQGSYVFKLTVTDNLGATASSFVTITVNPAPNISPVANAGSDVVVQLPVNSTTLNGSASDADGTVLYYEWNKISGPAQFTISTPGQLQTSINNLVQGTYQFELKVTDNAGAIGKDTVMIVVNAAPNVPPSAMAGTDQVITLPLNTITLTGNGSDPDGWISSYSWTKLSGPAPHIILTPGAAQTTVNNLVAGTYVFQLSVTDNNGAAAHDQVQITVNPAPNVSPQASAGADQAITLPVNSVNLNGSGTDTDGSITSYQWAKISGPASFTISNSGSAQTSVTNLVQGFYQFELLVTDNQGATGKDTVNITVHAALPPPNSLPVAQAGADQVIQLPLNQVVLNGSGADADGTITGYSWTKISGPASFSIVNPSQAQTNVTGLVQGVYKFELLVTDNAGATGKDTVQVTVHPSNLLPLAHAGPNQVITLPVNSVTVTGTGTDADGTISGYHWNKISGPAQFTIVNASNAQTAINNLVQGTYQFELVVTDNAGAIGKDTLSITVNAQPNSAPLANAGADQVITLPVNSVTLTGSGTDADGTITSYSWTKISGPATFILVNPLSSSTAINNLVAGIYQFELLVTDNQGASGKDTVNITVNAAIPVNLPPVAHAGADQVITLPVNSVTLAGNGTDTDGSIISYQWSKISGPAVFTIVSASAPQTSITNLQAGMYGFQLLVTDNSGATDKDTVLIQVNAAPNMPPAANAGADQTITLPVNTVSLQGAGSDPDGSISSYSWTKIAGPSTFTISNPTASNTLVNNLVQGVYKFELTVSDNSGATDRDTVSITVLPAIINLPPVSYAGADILVTLPANQAVLNGNGTDPDGTIAFYSWTKISGPAAYTIASANQAQTQISNLVQGIYEFELTVTDNGNATDKDTVRVVVHVPVNQPPVVFAGNDQVILLPATTATLSGSATDADGTIVSYQWAKLSGPASFTISNANNLQTPVNSLVAGNYLFELTAVDNNGDSGKDTVMITVSTVPNQVPVAYAGTDLNITLPVNSVVLNGSGTDPDGSITGYKWTKISGPASFNIISSTTSQTGVNHLVQGQYQFELMVTDNVGATDRDTVTVFVHPPVNVLPSAHAGADQTIQLPVNLTTLSGSGTDSDGSIAAYQWTKISGPVQYILSNGTTATAQAGNLLQGVYLFELRVTDNNGGIGRDTMQVTVLPVNVNPVANAGSDQTIQLPANSVTLNGSATDADGSVTAYQWTKISGPAQYLIGVPNQSLTGATNLVQGTYKFELKVTDNNGATGKDTMVVTVLPPNVVPVANAGNNIVLTLPQNATNLTGSGTDSDGSVQSYLWTKVSGPAQYQLGNASAAHSSLSNLVQGAYLFELKVTDNQGAVGRDTVSVTVHPQPNIAPVANAGADQVITLPVNSLTINGSGTDADGLIAGYQWTKISGPTSFTILHPGSFITTIDNLAEGVYEFELRVTDNLGAIDRDTVKVTVKPDSRTESTAAVYPNPAISTIEIKINAITHRNLTTLKIFNESGVMVYEEVFLRTQQVAVKQVDVSRLSKGTYFITLNVDINNNSTVKFVKQ